ncbi:MAG: hypothetical protein DYG98_06025 [Haliscomenobacteraceae bacterium CHB4]|nr:hypothetical protein [Saprospiraceae bacterium]MCE7922592.1 hypothetical protein [Haliscomenobacteraceae bacterium CHB4]
MHRSYFALLLLFLFACQNPQNTPSEESTLSEIMPPARYSPDAVQKMRWLAGSWKSSEAGRTIRQSFQFHGGNAMEVLIIERDGSMGASDLVWREDRLYYGQNRQWTVTWIGDKDVRFDPVQPGLMPMTWTRVNDHTWHLVRHSPGGDETTVMESVDEMQP